MRGWHARDNVRVHDARVACHCKRAGAERMKAACTGAEVLVRGRCSVQGRVCGYEMNGGREMLRSLVYAGVQILAKSDEVRYVFNSHGAPYVQLHAAFNSLLQILQLKGQMDELEPIRELVTRGDYMMNKTNQDSTE